MDAGGHEQRVGALFCGGERVGAVHGVGANFGVLAGAQKAGLAILVVTFFLAREHSPHALYPHTNATNR